MKFQKVLLIFYAVIQAAVATYLYAIGSLSPAYAIVTAFTLGLYVATHVRDPGYLIVDETQQQPEHSDEMEEEEVTIGNKREKKCKSRYCRICMINQPYRTKHCHECEKCVATFDHHCPWMSTCIGEKNRPLFLLYLYFQAVQFFLAALGICSVAVNKMNPLPSQLVLGLVLILVLSIILGLALFQTYLMLANMTTWELAKWDKIDYLNKHSRATGSPFSNGPARNTLDYWVWAFRRSRKIWEFQAN